VSVADTKRVELAIEGMTCASCAARIERKLNRLDGVEASVNLATEKASVRFDETRVALDDLVGAVEAAGYGASLDAVQRGEADRLGARLGAAALLAAPLVVLMLPPLRFDGWEWLSLALATPVVFWAGLPFHRAAVRAGRHRGATMDTLISLGTLAAWGWSTVALVGLADGHVYYEVAAVITTFILLGRYLERGARRRSGAAVRALLELGAGRRLRPTAWSSRAPPRSTSRC
jgi:P-type Cu+ transporter